MYRSLEVLNEKTDALQKRMNLKIGVGIGRNAEVCFYDAANYYFEIGENDEDIKDGDGCAVQTRTAQEGGVQREAQRAHCTDGVVHRR
ncbi:MAG: hypothetical protein LBU32_00300 [Clostridiales bacterium]|nr:hypothetical protein [Clostridiales bacterium]